MVETEGESAEVKWTSLSYEGKVLWGGVELGPWPIRYGASAWRPPGSASGAA